MQFKDYYQVLGVPRDAAEGDIKKAFRKLARKYHPDVSKEPDAQARMQEINEANAVLSDAEKRAAYDQLGRGYQPGQDFRPPPDWDAGFEHSGHGFSPGESADFSEFFAEMFGRGAGERAGHRAHGRNYQARGEDHYAKVLLDIEDAFTGATRPVTLRAPAVDAEGRMHLETRTLNVKIPRGVHEGQVIRLAGQGAPGIGGGATGDLLMEVRFKPHDRLRAQGRDLHLTLPLAPWEAALGAAVPVPLPDGTLTVKIPQGARAGSQLRLRGKGIPGTPPGDALLDLQIALPPADTPRARELYETMARDLAFDPRPQGRA
jgi:curved DNA-binding protein